MIIQNENESIFIPSMWHHEVYNLSEWVLSINHNWFNAFNLESIWNSLYSEYQKVSQSPMICKMKKMKIFGEDEIYGDVEKLLREESGNNFEKFVAFLSINTRNILDKLSEYEAIVEFVEDAVANEFEMRCNVYSLKKVVKVIAKCIDLECLNQRHVQQTRVIGVFIVGLISAIFMSAMLIKEEYVAKEVPPSFQIENDIFNILSEDEMEHIKNLGQSLGLARSTLSEEKTI